MKIRKRDVIAAVRESALTPSDDVFAGIMDSVRLRGGSDFAEAAEYSPSTRRQNVLVFVPVLAALLIIIGAGAVFGSGILSEKAGDGFPFEMPVMFYPNFTGVVLNVYEFDDFYSILIEVDKDDDYIGSCPMVVPLGEGEGRLRVGSEDDGIARVGDVVKVYYDGVVLESAPAQVHKPVSVKLLHREEEGNAVEWNWGEEYGEHEVQLQLPEFPDVVFEQGIYKVYNEYGGYQWCRYFKAIFPDGTEREIFSFTDLGWSGGFFIDDITGDGYPDFAYTVSYTSGLFTSSVLIYDFVNDKHYALNEGKIGRAADVLSLENGWIMVTSHEFDEPGGGTWDVMSPARRLVFVEGELRIEFR